MKQQSVISGLNPIKPLSSQPFHLLQEATGQEGQLKCSPHNRSTRRRTSPCQWKEANLSDSISIQSSLCISVKANTVLSYHFCRQDNTALAHRPGWHTRGLRSLLQHSELHCWARSDTIRMARARNKSQISPWPPAAPKFATFPSCHKINTSAFNTPWLSHSSWAIPVNLWHKRATAEIGNHNNRKSASLSLVFPCRAWGLLGF